mmetsp:Transcript_92544/g.188418  ORF Transcript_92544/g.188418 Transcript_92544/m.188418 type:complete len:267 (+) Transcript_92544:272-1072(+)
MVVLLPMLPMFPKLLPRRKFDPGVVAMERLMEGLLARVRLSSPFPRSRLSPAVPLSAIEAAVGVDDDATVAVPAVLVDMFATADMRAASPPCESTMVVMQEFSGSGGNRTLVMIPGTTSEKCLETKVDMRDDLPTPSSPSTSIVMLVRFCGSVTFLPSPCSLAEPEGGVFRGPMWTVRFVLYQTKDCLFRDLCLCVLLLARCAKEGVEFLFLSSAAVDSISVNQKWFWLRFFFSLGLKFCTIDTMNIDTETRVRCVDKKTALRWNW